MPARANPPARIVHPPRRWLLLLAAALIPAQGVLAQSQPAPAPQGNAPRSLLPDDIAEPPPPPPGAVEQAVPMAPSGTGPMAGFAPVPAPPPVVEEAPPPEPEPSDPLAELAGPTLLPDRAGLLTPATGGYAANLFAGSDARFLETLLARLDGPLGSRWAQILLQRALLSVADAPGPLTPGDWVAARADALVRLGAAADAHRLVSRIAIDRYTTRLYAAALQAAAAAGDPMALCPLSPLARVLTESPSWALADAMCLAVLGDEVGASALFDQLRRRNAITPFDIGLAERVASATGSGRRGANPEWEEAGGALTAWRLGLSSAAGLEIPEDLLARRTPVQQAWSVRLPGQSIALRAAVAAPAAGIGAISTAELNRLLAAEASALDPAAAGESPGGRLRTANVAADTEDRVRAMAALWQQADPATAAGYGWLLATAPAAARIGPNPALAADAPRLVASLVAAGIAGPAARWWPAVAEADAGARAAVWAQLAPLSASVPMNEGLFDAWAEGVPPHRAALLAAGLEGLGRGQVGAELPPLENGWTRALDRAVAARRTGEVILLSATALQGSWAEVHPDMLRRVARALVAVGHAAEARLIVAEAATRG